MYKNMLALMFILSGSVAMAQTDEPTYSPFNGYVQVTVCNLSRTPVVCSDSGPIAFPKVTTFTGCMRDKNGEVVYCVGGADASYKVDIHDFGGSVSIDWNPTRGYAIHLSLKDLPTQGDSWIVNLGMLDQGLSSEGFINEPLDLAGKPINALDQDLNQISYTTKIHIDPNTSK